MKQKRKERKSLLDITKCLVCGMEDITPDTFPHFGPKCIARMKRGEAPQVTRMQDTIDGDEEWD